ncbi:MAG TPA: hypothetical protein DGG94_21795 [Micromonosporaceae bacterium]|nr:hypothetical protein [Micromonosporaceae bacterium]HCU52394.1 hypothetical protein [Micromonosporaceae bacterium]
MVGATIGAAETQAIPGRPEIVIEVLSGRADLVTGGDALVEIKLPPGADTETLKIDVDGRDVSSAIARRADGRFYGRIDGLRNGHNHLRAYVQGARGAVLKLSNHPLGGPVFAGTQVEPWLCQNAEYGLESPSDVDCNAPVIIAFFYKSSVTGLFLPYDPASPPPALAIATATTDQGHQTPYIVRRERGTMTRGIYDIAVLYHPRQEWQPWASQRAWNHKALFKFEGNSRPGHQQGGGPSAINRGGPANVLDDQALSRGFVVASSSLMRNGTNANNKVAAEAVMMLREHVIERYGEIRYTIGSGCSGGAVQQHMIAANYPGLLNGIQPMCSFPDMWSTMTEVADCDLIARYFDQNPTLWLDVTQRAAVTGHVAASTCKAWQAVRFARTLFDPAVGCTYDETVRPDWVYDSTSNPLGTRCTLQDYQKAVFGADPATGFARRPWDNVGVQYGLAALREGRISAEQFVDLNEKVGGFDIDFVPAQQRTQADLTALTIAYRAGEVVSGQGLNSIPIMDLRGTDNATLHEDVFTYVMRARLQAANGSAGNQVAWTSPNPVLPDPAIPPASFDLMDRWLSAIEADTSGDPLEQKVLRHKPLDAVDSCWSAGQAGKCGTSLPYYSTTRIAAGGPLTNDILKCRLKALQPSDYPVAFTATQWSRLQRAFPSGACDWTKPGVGQQPPAGPWLTFAGTVGGRPLGPPPKSHPIR